MSGVRTREHEDLPILEELGRDLGGAFRREERAVEARRRRRRRGAAVLAAGLLLLVPGAVATRYIWAPTPDSVDPRRPFQDSRPVVVAEGAGEQERWRLSAYASDRGTCLQLAVFDVATGQQHAGCQASEAVSLQQVAAQDGFVFGQVPRNTARVTVEVHGRPRVTVAVRAPDAEVVRRSGLPAALRFYVATFPEPIGEDRVTVFALDRSGRVTGRAGAR